MHPESLGQFPCDLVAGGPVLSEPMVPEIEEHRVVARGRVIGGGRVGKGLGVHQVSHRALRSRAATAGAGGAGRPVHSGRVAKVRPSSRTRAISSGRAVTANGRSSWNKKT